MQLSSNVPHGPRAVREYMKHRGNMRLPVNVSPEADAAYIAERGLKIGPTTLKSWPVGICVRCRGVVRNAPFLSNTERAFCSQECRDAGNVPAKPHQRWKSIPIAKSKKPYLQPTQNTGLAKAVLSGLMGGNRQRAARRHRWNRGLALSAAEDHEFVRHSRTSGSGVLVQMGG